MSSLRNQLKLAARNGLETIAGEDIFDPFGKKTRALVTAPSADSAFIPGLELESETIRARIIREETTAIPRTNTTWTIRGKRYRLKTFELHPASILMNFQPEKN